MRGVTPWWIWTLKGDLPLLIYLVFQLLSDQPPGHPRQAGATSGVISHLPDLKSCSSHILYLFQTPGTIAG